MQPVEFKLNQASAILGVSAKELQNLVQLKVIRPARRDNLYWFDRRRLLQAKIAFYLKEALGSSSELLSLFTEALSSSLGIEDSRQRQKFCCSRARRVAPNPLRFGFRCAAWRARWKNNCRGQWRSPFRHAAVSARSGKLR